MIRVFALSCCAAAAGSAVADVVTLTPVADAFMTSAQPTSNYGGGGGLSLAAPGLPQGEFQSVLRFDTSTAVATFNAAFGTGQWRIQGVSLQLTPTSPTSSLFNTPAAGQCAMSWMQNDSWVEGSGTPMSPGTTGITFATLPSFLSPADENLGTFNYDGMTTSANTYTLALTPNFVADLSAGGLVSLRASAVGSTISYVFNSRTFGTAANRPMLSITAGPSACYANCDGSTVAPILNVNDFICFQTAFAAGQSYANCDGSTTPPILNVNDFICFQTQFAAGCP